MLNDNNLILLLLAFLPALAYSFIIYFNDRNNIKIGTALSYLIGGCISITFFDIITNVFPRFQEMMFTTSSGVLDLSTMSLIQQPTTLTWVAFAFVQVALLEEVTKAMAWGSMSLFRQGEHRRQNTLFSTMFYSCMISVGFAGIENLQYLISTPTSELFIQRSLTAVITHMICGLLMGYFLALARLKKNLFNRLGFQLIGILAAVLFHGAYDFLVLTMFHVNLPFIIPFTTAHGKPFHLLILAGLVIVTICGRTLLNYSLRYGKIQRTRNPSHPIR